jgi:Fe-S cluster biosynthesis and repair protein YggX
MDTQQRIAQFENMCAADPENDMAHFSLAGAYAQVGRHADAAASYTRCFSLNPAMSKAYQLAAENLVKTGDTEAAASVATEGYVAAAERGDLLPKNAMGDLLKSLGKPLPEVAVEAAPAPAAGGFTCQRTGRQGSQLPRPPMKGPVGEWIHANISAETWRDWIGQGTKVINELRLDFSREEDQETYERHMREFLGIDDTVVKQLAQQSR